MTDTFPHTDIEQKWQAQWHTNNTLSTLSNRPRPVGVWVFPVESNQALAAVIGADTEDTTHATDSAVDTQPAVTTSDTQDPQADNEPHNTSADTPIAPPTQTTQQDTSPQIPLPSLDEDQKTKNAEAPSRRVRLIITNQWNEVLVLHPAPGSALYGYPQLLHHDMVVSDSIPFAPSLAQAIVEGVGGIVDPDTIVRVPNTELPSFHVTISSTDPLVLADMFEKSEWLPIRQALDVCASHDDTSALFDWTRSLPAYFKMDVSADVAAQLRMTQFRERVAGFIRLRGTDSFVSFTKKNSDVRFIPGGTIDPGESVMHAFVRETQEEVGIQSVKNARLVATVHEFLPFHGVHSHSVSHYVYAEIDPAALILRAQSEIDAQTAGHDGQLMLSTKDNFYANKWDNFDDVLAQIAFEIEIDIAEDEIAAAQAAIQPLTTHNEDTQKKSITQEIEETPQSTLPDTSDTGAQHSSSQSDTSHLSAIDLSVPVSTDVLDAAVLALIPAIDPDTVVSPYDTAPEPDSKPSDSDENSDTQDTSPSADSSKVDSIWDMIQPRISDQDGDISLQDMMQTATQAEEKKDLSETHNPDIDDNQPESELEEHLIDMYISPEDEANQQVTVQWYNNHVEQYVISTPLKRNNDEFKQWIDRVLVELPPEAEILEIGSGFGRDADYIESLHYHVRRTDAAHAMIELQQDTGKTAEVFNPLTDSLEAEFDAIFAHGVFHHFTEAQALVALKNCAAYLRPKGHAALSMKMGDGEEMQDGRLRHYWQSDRVQQLAQQAGCEVISMHHINNSNTDEDQWITCLLQKL